jgi:hypothetical protein
MNGICDMCGAEIKVRRHKGKYSAKEEYCESCLKDMSI